MKMSDSELMEARWRLILGQFASDRLSVGEGFGEAEEALSFLYDREYEGRGVRAEGMQGGTWRLGADRSGLASQGAKAVPQADCRVLMP